MIDGVRVKVGERELVMPKLTVGLLKKHWPAVSALNKRVKAAAGESEMLDVLHELMDAQISLMHAALRRNYPDLSRDELEEGIEVGDVGRLFAQLLVASHMAPKEGGAGEAVSPQS